MENIMKAYEEVPEMAHETGYKMKTTYWGDFTVAEKLGGIASVEATFFRAFQAMKDDEIYMTELYMIANWKVWQHYKKNKKLARAYQEICDKLDEYILDGDAWTKEQKQYFIKTTD